MPESAGPPWAGPPWAGGGSPLCRSGPLDDLASIMGGPVDDDLFDVPSPTYWPGLGAVEAAERWEGLRRWVEALCRRFPHLDHHVVPQCWWRHNEHVEALSALWDHERSSFSGTSPATAPLEWLRALRDVGALLRAWTAESGCGASHREPPARLRALDDDDWERHVAADVARRRVGEIGDDDGGPQPLSS